MSEALTKQGLLDAICAILHLEPFVVGVGSTEPSDFVRAVAAKVGVPVSPNESKIALAEKIANRAGIPWTTACDSRASSSGGGSTITLEGLKTLQESVQRILEDDGPTESPQAEQFVIDIRPDASALRLFKSMSFTLWYALGEFIDNSISSALQCHDLLQDLYQNHFQLSVDVKFDEQTESIVISDNAGGISQRDFERAMRTSEPPPETSAGLGLHGVGMKAAAFWLGRTLEVETQPIGEVNSWNVRIDLDELTGPEGRFAEVVAGPPRSLPGTTIRITNLWNGVPKGKSVSAIRRYLPSIYRSFLDPGSPRLERPMVLLFQGIALSYKSPQILVSQYWPTDKGPVPGSAELTWRDEVEIRLSNGKSISGWVGILEVMGRDAAGFFLHYRGKGVAGVVPEQDSALDGPSRRDDVRSAAYKPRQIFGDSGLYRDQSYVGEFDVSQFGKTITTDSVMWTSEEESEFLQLLLEKMKDPRKNYWLHAHNYRRRRVQKVDVESKEKVVEEVINRFSQRLSGGTFGHDVVETVEEVQESEIDLTDSQKQWRFTIADGQHFHKFLVVFTQDADQAFLRLHENEGDFEHQIFVNEQHPSLSRFLPLSDSTLWVVIQLALALGVAEVFLESPDRGHIRSKMNEMLDKFGGGLDD